MKDTPYILGTLESKENHYTASPAQKKTYIQSHKLANPKSNVKM